MTRSMVVEAPPCPVLTGTWTARLVRPSDDVALVQRWMSSPHVAAFWKQPWSRGVWEDELVRQLNGAHSLPFIVEDEGEAFAYVEVYRVVRDRLAAHYAHRAHDLGIHLAIGELYKTGRGLGRSLLRAIVDGLFAVESACTRVVAEPDINNRTSIKAFTAAGFHACGEVSLSDKTAQLLVHPRCPEDLP